MKHMKHIFYQYLTIIVVVIFMTILPVIASGEVETRFGASFFFTGLIGVEIKFQNFALDGGIGSGSKPLIMVGQRARHFRSAGHVNGCSPLPNFG